MDYNFSVVQDGEQLENIYYGAGWCCGTDEEECPRGITVIAPLNSSEVAEGGEKGD